MVFGERRGDHEEHSLQDCPESFVWLVSSL